MVKKLFEVWIHESSRWKRNACMNDYWGKADTAEQIAESTRATPVSISPSSSSIELISYIVFVKILSKIKYQNCKKKNEESLISNLNINEWQ